jgi:hypothetical protein
MQIQRSALWTLGFAFVAAFALHAAEQDDAKKIIDKAIKAHGGQEKLTKLKAVTMRLKGTIHSPGGDIPFTGEVVTQGVGQRRLALDAETNGTKFTFVQVLNGDKGWQKINDDTQELSADQLAEAKEQAYESWAATLAPLDDKAFALSSLGEVKVEDRPAIGIRVSSKGHRDVNLYFDKELSVLVKSEIRVKDEESGMEVNQESTYSDFKEIDGIKEPTKIVVKKDGKPFVEATVEQVKREEKADDSIFAKP